MALMRPVDDNSRKVSAGDLRLGQFETLALPSEITRVIQSTGDIYGERNCLQIRPASQRRLHLATT
jgi:hypothetical protein